MAEKFHSQAPVQGATAGQSWQQIREQLEAEWQEERQALFVKDDPKINPWKADFLPKCEELALLPIGGNKIPVDLETGRYLSEWQEQRYTVEQLQQPNEYVRALGFRPGPESSDIRIIDLDGPTAKQFFEERGALLEDVGWVIRRSNAPGRNKAAFTLTAEQAAALPLGKSKLTLKPGKDGKPGEQIELFNGIGQCVIAGRHPNGGRYINDGDPTTAAPPNDAWWAALLEYTRQWQLQSTRVQARSSAADAGDLEWENSSPENPCPICGRTHSSWCSTWVNKVTGDTGVNCHHGSNGAALALTTIPASDFLPEQRVEPSTVVTGHDGQEWAYTGDGTKSGNDSFSKFVLDRPAEKQRKKKEPRPLIKAGAEKLEGSDFILIGWADSKRNEMFYRKRQTGQIGKIGGLNDRELLKMAPLTHWIEIFGELDKKTGKRHRPIDWESARSSLIEQTDRLGVFDVGQIRGRGVWWDDDRVVWNLGNRLEVEGSEQAGLDLADGVYCYEHRHRMRIDSPADPITEAEPMSDAEGQAIFDLLMATPMRGTHDALHLIGFIVCSPVAGALDKNPHLQIVDKAGGGKNDLMDHCITPLQGGIAVRVAGATEAGVRQMLKHDSLPVIVNESEQSQPGKRKALLDLLRYMYDGEATARGTTHGEALVFNGRSMVCLAGINAELPNQADRMRIARITRRQVTEAAWIRYEAQRAELVTREAGRRLIRRTVSNLRTLRHNATQFKKVIAERINGRAGDTYGPLLAGALLLFSTDQLDAAKAAAWLDRWEWGQEATEGGSEAAESESEQCLAHLMRFTVRSIGSDVGVNGEVTLGELVAYVRRGPGNESSYFNGPGDRGLKAAKLVLARYGLKVDVAKGESRLVIGRSELKSPHGVYAATQWAHGAWAQRLADLPGAKLDAGKVRFTGDTKTHRSMALPLDLVAPLAKPGEEEED